MKEAASQDGNPVKTAKHLIAKCAKESYKSNIGSQSSSAPLQFSNMAYPKKGGGIWTL
jgi:hypothetical protein